MAETKRNPKTEHEKNMEEYYNEKVPIHILKPDGETDNAVTVTLNGLNYRVVYGRDVMVPRKVAMIIEESIKNKQSADEEAERYSGYHELGTLN